MPGTQAAASTSAAANGAAARGPCNGRGVEVRMTDPSISTLEDPATAATSRAPRAFAGLEGCECPLDRPAFTPILLFAALRHQRDAHVVLEIEIAPRAVADRLPGQRLDALALGKKRLRARRVVVLIGPDERAEPGAVLLDTRLVCAQQRGADVGHLPGIGTAALQRLDLGEDDVRE